MTTGNRHQRRAGAKLARGAPPTAEDKANQALVELVQAKTEAFNQAFARRELVVLIRDEMSELYQDLAAKGRECKTEASELKTELDKFKVEIVRPARMHVIAVGLALLEGVPKQPRVRSATMEEAAALAKEHGTE